MTGAPSFFRYWSMSKRAVRNIGVVAVRVETCSMRLTRSVNVSLDLAEKQDFGLVLSAA